eukprot:TRINITY_DN3385_c0_g1_i1.p1 TRINITY_DN3385_c0_g1~~TRINITY_DN3385_c0_g1_i1.p1  ORF type:complete len:597 (-),score=72.02 TRINITY_DN3385_c0_g1_i1:15-1805(-)
MPVVYLPSDPLRSVSERPAPQRRFSAQGVVLPSPYTLPLGTHLPRRPQSSKQRERLFRVPTTPVNTRGEPNVTPRPQNPFLISSSTSAVAHNATQHSTPTHSSANAPQTLIEREEVPGIWLEQDPPGTYVICRVSTVTPQGHLLRQRDLTRARSPTERVGFNVPQSPAIKANGTVSPSSPSPASPTSGSPSPGRQRHPLGERRMMRLDVWEAGSRHRVEMEECLASVALTTAMSRFQEWSQLLWSQYHQRDKLQQDEDSYRATLVAEWLAEGAGIRLNDSERSARLRLCTDEAHIRSLLLEKMKRHHEILQSFEDAISEVTHTEQLCRYTMKECEATARSALGTIFRALTAALLFRIAEREREELQENERRIERSEWETRCMLGSSWCLEISALWTQFKTKRDCISCTTDEANSRRAIICDEVHSLGVWQLNLRASFQAVEGSHTTQRCEALARESVESQQWFEWQALLARETAFRLAVHVWSLEKVERVFITDAEHAAWTLLLTRDSEGFRNAMGHQRLLRWLLAQQEADRLEIMAEESSVRHQSWKELAITIEQLEKINPHIAGCPFHRKKDCPFFGHRNIVHVPVPLEPPLVL